MILNENSLGIMPKKKGKKKVSISKTETPVRASITFLGIPTACEGKNPCSKAASKDTTKNKKSAWCFLFLLKKFLLI
jgi:hypothetical protein